jgi:lipopolysaccharide assembly protein A
MLRFLRILFLALLGIALLAVASANLEPVTVRALPEDMALVLGKDWQIELPLFIVRPWRNTSARPAIFAARCPS